MNPARRPNRGGSQYLRHRCRPNSRRCSCGDASSCERQVGSARAHVEGMLQLALTLAWCTCSGVVHVLSHVSGREGHTGRQCHADRAHA